MGNETKKGPNYEMKGHRIHHVGRIAKGPTPLGTRTVDSMTEVGNGVAYDFLSLLEASACEASLH